MFNRFIEGEYCSYWIIPEQFQFSVFLNEMEEI